MNNLFIIGGKSSPKLSKILALLGVAFFLLTWEIAPRVGLVNEKTIPTVSTVIQSGITLMQYVNPQGDTFFGAVGYSVSINLKGFLVAFILSVVVGGFMGLYAPIDDFTKHIVEPLRFIPLTGVVALFVGWFGIDDPMKIMFLGFSIFVYLLPVVRETLKNVPKQFRQTGETLGGSQFQILKDIYIPYVMPIIFENAMVLSAVSWTYIVIAETFNMTQQGLGTLMWIYPRKGDLATGLFVLFVLMILAASQAAFMKVLHKLIWPHKYDTNLRTSVIRWFIKPPKKQ